MGLKGGRPWAALRAFSISWGVMPTRLSSRRDKASQSATSSGTAIRVKEGRLSAKSLPFGVVDQSPAGGQIHQADAVVFRKAAEVVALQKLHVPKAGQNHQKDDRHGQGRQGQDAPGGGRLLGFDGAPGGHHPPGRRSDLPLHDVALRSLGQILVINLTSPFQAGEEKRRGQGRSKGPGPRPGPDWAGRDSFGAPR